MTHATPHVRHACTQSLALGHTRVTRLEKTRPSRRAPSPLGSGFESDSGFTEGSTPEEGCAPVFFGGYCKRHDETTRPIEEPVNHARLERQQKLKLT